MNTSPWDATGPSQFGAHFYTPGWSPKPVKQVAEPKPSPLNPPKPLDEDAVRAYRATHTIRETAKHFGCTQRHLYRKYYDAAIASPAKPIDRAALHAYRMTGKSINDCAKKFRIGKLKVKALLDGMPKLINVSRNPNSAGVRMAKLNARYTFHVTPEQALVIQSMGGAAWIRKLIDQANTCYFSDSGDRDREAVNGR